MNAITLADQLRAAMIAEGITGEPLRNLASVQNALAIALFESAPLLMLELKEVCAQYEALLQAHGKPWGWGTLATLGARKLIAKVEGSK